MKVPDGAREDRIVLGVQISIVICFYFFTAGIFAFLWHAVYRSVADNDHPVHAVVLASVITIAFLILASVMTMVFSVIIREGRKKFPANGGLANETEIK